VRLGRGNRESAVETGGSVCFHPAGAGVCTCSSGFLMDRKDKNTVFWIERRRGGREKLKITIQARPLTWVRFCASACGRSWRVRC